jgi:EAL domain-containing protein (putative c-di-GMP-specific phosphodiesterase class I)
MPISMRSDPGPDTAGTPSGSRTPWTRGLRFLVVEDHELQRQMLRSMLLHMGASEVWDAGEGKAALAIAKREGTRVDVVITDLDMPGMDGMEFIRRLGNDGYGGLLVIISGMERSLVESVEAMATAYGMTLLGAIGKPAKPENLANLLRSTQVPATDRRKPREPDFTLEEVLQGLANGEFEPYFQPKIELATGRVRGAEALARWRHPTRGMIPPAAFIPQLEKAGRINDLTWIILEKAAAFCRAQRAAGLHGTVAVNLSPTAISEEGFAERVLSAVLAQGVEPRNFVLEITESAATVEVGKALENLSRLRMKGFGLSIDDYGTGYSSMRQLARIAFTELKVDQSFIRDASQHASSMAVLQSSLELARKLKIAAVVEGVETEDNMDLLRQLGCDQIQGFFIARPMEAGAYLEWLKARP